MLGCSWASLVNSKEAPRQDWSEVDFSQLAAVRDDIANVTRRITEADGTIDAEAETLHRVIARLILDRFRDPFDTSAANAGWSPLADVILGTFGTVWGAATQSAAAAKLPTVQLAPPDLTAYVKEITSTSHCSVTHPLFTFAAEEATREQLAALLEAENLCDLNFVNILSLLMPGADGEPAAEMASNLWDELGHGEVARFHRNARMALMRNVGLRLPNAEFDLSPYMLEEIEHFNTYALNGTVRAYSLRLVGMLFATEFLVPQQLAAVIQGWRRVGLLDAEMEYLIDHCEGDVEHANGWADRVVVPCLLDAPSAQSEVLIGVNQHLDVLGRLYDRLLNELVSGSLMSH